MPKQKITRAKSKIKAKTSTKKSTPIVASTPVRASIPKKKTNDLVKYRWLIWTVAIAVFMTIAVVGYIKITDVNFDREAVGSLSDPGAWRNYTNKSLGFSLRYPSNWVLESPASNIILFESSKDISNQITVSILEAKDEPAIRGALNDTSEERVAIDDIDGPRIVNELADGETEIVILARPDTRLFVIRGTSKQIDDIIGTVKFFTPIEQRSNF
ncbi:MAG: hypothetical protein Q8P83_02180 [bacterium]|nr:hypothetical protein [bacterium]